MVTTATTIVGGVVMTEVVVAVGALMEDTAVEAEDLIVGAGNAAAPLPTIETDVALQEATGGDDTETYCCHRLPISH